MTTGALWQLAPFELTARFWSSIGRRSHQSWERSRPLSLSRHGEKAFEVARAALRKLCHVVLESGLLIGRGAHGWRPFPKDSRSDWINRPPQIRRLRVHSFPILPRGLRQLREPPSPVSRAIPVTLYGSGVANVRSDKDSEPETYGEGIKKEIQYRRTLCLKTIICRRDRPAASVKTPKFDGDEGGFCVSAEPQKSLKKTVATGRFSVGRSVG